MLKGVLKPLIKDIHFTVKYYQIPPHHDISKEPEGSQLKISLGSYLKMKELENCDHNGPILYVLVVGFHHKKGCLIEYCFPKMRHTEDSNGEENDGDDDSTNNGNDNKRPFKLPKVWRTLPSIALPDGAHNYDRDTIFFHLPHPDRPLSTIYGISCYRQIASDRLQCKTDDVTRGTVQKCVVLLSELPLYGLIAAKCEMITYAYFNEFDFSKVDCLKELYFNLNGLLTEEYLNSSEVFLGLSPRDLIATFQHKILILFKLILLEKKVLFYKSPVKDLCSIILTLLSLFPGMIEEGGLDYSSTSVVPKPSSGRKFSGDIELLDPLIQEIDAKEKELNSSKSKLKTETIEDSATSNNTDLEKEDGLLLTEKENYIVANNIEEEETAEGITEEVINQEKESNEPDSPMLTTKDESEEEKIVTDGDDNGTEQIEIFDDIDNDVLNISHEDIEEVEDQSKDSQEHVGSSTPPLFKLPLSECGLPLRIFGNGSFCHPYLSITYLDILSDSRVRSCVVGATNFLFKQKRNLFDIIIEIDGAKIEINDPELRKRVTLSTEDLRFADYLVKAALEGQVINKNSNTVQLVPNDGSSWEGCDDWLRYQFKIYLLHLLRTSQCEENSREYASFNSLFMASWKETYNYRLWSALSKPGIFEVNPGHPFHGQLSIADMKLKLSQAFSNTERGKKLNQTLGQTSKAVGGAFSSAKTAVSSWWSSQWNSTNRTRDVSPTNTSSYSLSGLLKSLDKNPPEESKPKEDI